VVAKETYLLNIFLAAKFKFKDLDLEYFLLRFLNLIIMYDFSTSRA